MSSTAGPSRQGTRASEVVIAPSTSGDSESTMPKEVEKGLDVSVLRELARTALVESLNEGAKTLVLDPAVSGPLNLITEVALLRHQGVDKMFWIDSAPLNVSTRNVVWLCRPKMDSMRIIAEQIRQQQASPSPSGPLVYTILCVPRVTELCRKVLEDEGVAGDVTLSEFKMELIPLEEDHLSMEMDDAARDIYLNGDDTPLFYASLALMTFQRAFGLFPRILGKGDAAKRLAGLLQRHRASGESQYADLQASDSVDGLIIVDRSVDWVTPMCTQLTYEGMIDEYMGIKNGHVQVDASLLDPANQPATSPSTLPPAAPQKRKHHLTASKDRLFGDLRDLNFAIVGSRLSRIARRLEGDYGGAKNLKSVSQMKDFVGKLGGLQSEQKDLRLHTGLTEALMPTTRTEIFNKNLEAQQNLVAGYDVSAQLGLVEDLLFQESRWQMVLRTLVLASLTNGGIKPKVLESFKRDFLQTYGYHHLPLLIALENLGLLVKTPSAVPLPFSTLRKPLRLVVDDIDDAAPNDISYVYSGYAPLSIRLVQCITQKNAILTGPAGAAAVDQASVLASLDGGGEGKRRDLPKAHPITGWKGFEDVLAALPGATVDVRQKDELKREKVDGTKTTVVFFLGGCTYTEISALRWMARQTSGRRFVIATTGIINGSTLLESFGDRPPVSLKSSS